VVFGRSSGWEEEFGDESTHCEEHPQEELEQGVGRIPHSASEVGRHQGLCVLAIGPLFSSNTSSDRQTHTLSLERPKQSLRLQKASVHSQMAVTIKETTLSKRAVR
jgi:hypothetical protein